MHSHCSDNPLDGRHKVENKNVGVPDVVRGHNISIWPDINRFCPFARPLINARLNFPLYVSGCAGYNFNPFDLQSARPKKFILVTERTAERLIIPKN